MASDSAQIRDRIWRAALWTLFTAVLLLAGWMVVFQAPEPRRYPGRIPVRMWHMWTANWADVVEDIVDRYNESQDIYEVIPLSIPTTSASGLGTTNASQKVLLSIAGGDPPDCMAQWNPVLPAWAEQGLIRPLDEIATPEEMVRFRDGAYPIAQKIGMHRERLYGVTTGVNTHGLYFNLNHLREAGLDPNHLPETLEELSVWRDKLTKRDKQGNLTRLGFAPPIDFRLVIPIFGDDLYDSVAKAVNLDSEELAAAIRYIYESNQHYGFDDVIRFNASVSTGATGGSDWPFISGQNSIAFDGAWRVEQLAKHAPDLEYVTGRMPSSERGGPPRGFSNANFMIIPRGAKQPEGAWDFIKFWSGLDDPVDAATSYIAGGWLPTMRATGEAPVYQDYLRRFPQFATFLGILDSEGLQPTPPVINQVYLNELLIRIFEFASRGSRTPEQLMQFFKREWLDEERRRRELHP